MKKLTILSILLLSIHAFSQDYEYGVMFNVTNTTLTVPNSDIFISSNGGISRGSDNTGFENNIALGFYGSFNIQPDMNLAVDLFYDKTSSKDLSDIKFGAINLVPYFDYEFFGIGLYANLGVGIGFIIDEPDFENNDLFNADIETNKTDFIAKIALGYNFKDYGRVEIGTYPAVSKVVDDALGRNKHYIGIKLPINKYLRR